MPTGSLQAKKESSGLSGVPPSEGRSLYDCGADAYPDEGLTLGAMQHGPCWLSRMGMSAQRMPEGLKGIIEEIGTVAVVQRCPNVGRGQIWENLSCIALPRTLRLQHSASVGEIAGGLFSGVRVYSLADMCMLFLSEQH